VKALLAAAAAAVTAAVAASRVLLGVHWVTDVVGGVALGFGWFVVCSVAFGGALLHFAAPAERVEAEEERAGDGAPPPRDGRGRLAAVSPTTDPEPTDEQVRQRAETLAAEPGNPRGDPEAQARALLEESEGRVEDPAARQPNHRGVIRRGADEGVEDGG
jgi:hypothetical protein